MQVKNKTLRWAGRSMSRYGDFGGTSLLRGVLTRARESLKRARGFASEHRGRRPGLPQTWITVARQRRIFTGFAVCR